MTTATRPPQQKPKPGPKRPPANRYAPSELLRKWLIGKPEPTGPRPMPTDLAIGISALTTLAALLFGLFAQVVVIGTLQHNRNQQIAYDDLRLTQAEGTTPVGATEGKYPDKGTPLARIEIPSIGVKEVILEGTTSSVLRSGIGHRRDTVNPGQQGISVIMGRRFTYGGPFAKLGSLDPGAEIKVSTGQGDAVFKVSAVREAGDVQRYPGGARLTLVTTSGSQFAPKDVLRVDADLVEGATPFQAARPQFNANTLPRDERELRGEPNALKGVIGWGLLLVVAALAVQWLRIRWGRWQSWLIAIPTLGLFGVEVADYVARLLPNLL